MCCGTHPALLLYLVCDMWYVAQSLSCFSHFSTLTLLLGNRKGIWPKNSCFRTPSDVATG